MRNALIISVALVALLAGTAQGDHIVLGAHADHPIAPGSSLEDIRLSVGLAVEEGRALFTFANVSVNSETAVFKEIVIDGYDDDDARAILWRPHVLTKSKLVNYCVSRHPNGLPGFNAETRDPVGLIELQAKKSPIKYGLGAGEILEVRFNTSLADGSTIQDYFNSFGGGEDTADYSIGFHAINSSALNGQSLSGAVVPEPVTLAMLAFGGLTILLRKTRR